MNETALMIVYRKNLRFKNFLHQLWTGSHCCRDEKLWDKRSWWNENKITGYTLFHDFGFLSSFTILQRKFPVSISQPTFLLVIFSYILMDNCTWAQERDYFTKFEALRECLGNWRKYNLRKIIFSHWDNEWNNELHFNASGGTEFITAGKWRR